MISIEEQRLARAAALLRAGALVAFPTETVYGLGANALDAAAVARIFAAKGRPADNPLIVHIDGEAMLATVVAAVPPDARKFIRRFWPGPLTLVLPRTGRVPDIVTAGLPNVAVRMPAHPLALALITAANVPLAAPSANRSGRPSPTTAAHVIEDLPDVFVLDGGATEHGLESTVVAFGVTPRVLREGAVTLEQLRELVPATILAAHAEGERVESPGQKYKHYAPRVPLILFARTRVDALLQMAEQQDQATILCIESDAVSLRTRTSRPVVSLGVTAADVAHSLFAELRRHDRGMLLVLAIERDGIGAAVMDRLTRAASTIVT